MKKYITLFCLLLIITTLSGCSILLGGTNERELGSFVPVYSDGNFDYIEYNLNFEDGLINKSSSGYALYEASTADEGIEVIDTSATQVLSAYISALSGGAVCAEGYDYLYDALDTAFDISDEDSYCEILILENQGEIYGALNFYSRPSGRSGSLLTFENIIKSVFVRFTGSQVDVIKELENTAVLAFNNTHLITYNSKKIYSVNLENGEELFLTKDKWWDKGPSYYNDFKVSFTHESFLIYALADNGYVQKETLMAGGLDGTDFTILIDNQKIEY